MKMETTNGSLRRLLTTKNTLDGKQIMKVKLLWGTGEKTQEPLNMMKTVIQLLWPNMSEKIFKINYIGNRPTGYIKNPKKFL